MRRKLYHLASLGLISGYGNVTPIAGPHSAQARRERDGSLLVQFALATPERLEKLRTKLDRLDQASAQALAENEEKLRRARTELQRIRERAYEITMPDGTIRKVYRDGNSVRDDDGNEVSPDIVRAEDIPGVFPTWQERRGAGHRVEGLEQERRDIEQYRERLGQARERVDAGGLTEEEADRLEAELADMPEPVRRHYQPDAEPPAQAAPQRRTDSTFTTQTSPLRDFAAVAPGAPVPSTEPPDPQVRPPTPNASTPAPV